MAEDQAFAGSCSEPELNFNSPLFNPLKALRASGLRPPDPRARPLDNLYRCRALLPEEHPDALQLVVRQPKSREAAEAAERAKARTSFVALQRERARSKTNPLDELAERVRKGPLLLLKCAYDTRARLRVVTRHARGVRGIAEGTLVAFDKYFNLVLRDVEESYTVRLMVERPAGPGGTRMRRAPKQERRQRRLKQVFLRGDNVVLVSLATRAGGAGDATAASAEVVAGLTGA